LRVDLVLALLVRNYTDFEQIKVQYNEKLESLNVDSKAKVSEIEQTVLKSRTECAAKLEFHLAFPEITSRLIRAIEVTNESPERGNPLERDAH
jgi:hypothetical protein